ncbi:cysteine-rich secretory 2 [Podarcis lilfordi]|uniref:Cysteine-rich secretory 2 n=1 Tax=Podarcis lilfordi TaxID=74358 RepID=A0AA35NZ51_9SAUR|nr:cysteine-rich secretory 2 [Podarcis lilfordi]
MILLILCACLAAALHQSAAQASDHFASLSTINEDQKKEIVDIHNKLRREVQPPASNMVKMEWSDDIRKIAQWWANQCTLEHSAASDRTLNGTSCGENLFMSTSLKSWTEAILSWYNERDDFLYASGAKTEGAVIGHYTQVVWYISHLIGCAIAFCPDQEYQYYYVCQYSPAGNIKGKIATPYEAGEPCGRCPNDCDKGLCTNPCTERNLYSNCASLKDQVGCDHPIMGKCHRHSRVKAGLGPEATPKHLLKRVPIEKQGAQCLQHLPETKDNIINKCNIHAKNNRALGKAKSPPPMPSSINRGPIFLQSKG